MSRRLDRAVREWLLAEQSGDAELGERRLACVFASLDRRSPLAGFADRVLVAAGISRASSRVWQSRWLRAGVAGGLVGCGLALALLPAVLAAVFQVTHLFGLSLVSDAWHWTIQWIDLSFASWAVVEDVAAALRAALGHPTTILLLAVNVLVAAASLLGLRRLLVVPEEMIRC